MSDFLRFVAEFDPEGSVTNTLSEYFDEWMKSGDAIELTAGNHDLFLQVFILVADQIRRDSSFLGPDRKLPIQFLLVFSRSDGEDDEPPDFMSPEYWKLFVFRRKYGDRAHIDSTA